jgi:hypothetical protein
MDPLVQYQVIADYEVHDPHPLILEADAQVRTLRKDLSWPGWVWIEAKNLRGWIPEAFLKDAEARETTTACAFDGTDLSARKDQLLTRLDAAPGWIYALNEEGFKGWFPHFNLRPRQDTSGSPSYCREVST